MMKKIILLTTLFFNFHLLNSQEHFNTDDIKRKLAEMVYIDQSLRMQVDFSKQDESLLEKIQKVDRENTSTLKEILNTHYWITISEFGKEADQHAWLLVQHADHDIKFQEEILARLEKLYPTKTAAAHFAHLYDRVAKNNKRPQRYGTQLAGDGTCIPHAIEDPDDVDARRKSVGLPPLQEYLNQMERYIEENSSLKA